MIKKLTIGDVNKAVFLHQEGMPNDFLASFGTYFLNRIHYNLIKSKTVITLGNFEKENLNGIIYGSFNTSATYSEILRTGFFSLAPIIIVKFILKPKMFISIIQAILYPNQHSKSDIKAELLILSISKVNRHAGIGSKLINQLKENFKNNHVYKFKVSTKESNLAANNFYIKNKGQYQKKISIFNTVWNLYYFYIKE